MCRRTGSFGFLLLRLLSSSKLQRNSFSENRRSGNVHVPLQPATAVLEEPRPRWRRLQDVTASRMWTVLGCPEGQQSWTERGSFHYCCLHLLDRPLTAVRPLHILLLRFETLHRSQSTGGFPVLAWTGMQAENPLPVLGGFGCAAIDVVVPIFPSVRTVVRRSLQILFLSSPSSSCSPPPQASLLIGGREGSCR